MKLLSKLNLSRFDLVLMSGFFLLNCFLQLFNLKYVAAPYTDEGVYLYPAKLISQGYLPYRDFMLSHPPLTMFVIAIFFKLFGVDLFLLRALYVLFVQSAILPIYILVKNHTKSTWPAIISVALISTFIEFIHHDARFFALRQCEIVLLVYTLFFFRLSKGRISQFICGFLLGLGLTVTLAHIFVLASFLIAVFTLHRDTKFREIISQHSYLFLGFFISLIPLVLTFFIPGAWNCLIGFQGIRPRMDLRGRISILSGVIINDPFIFTLGLLGSLFLNPALNRIAAIVNILTLFFITFFPNSLYPHYYVILGPTLAISAGILFDSCFKKRDFSDLSIF
jgi:4-amino-4-deoxy-L-arabinose transferase-like glycosyltransferase